METADSYPAICASVYKYGPAVRVATLDGGTTVDRISTTFGTVVRVTDAAGTAVEVNYRGRTVHKGSVTPEPHGFTARDCRGHALIDTADYDSAEAVMLVNGSNARPRVSRPEWFQV